MLVLSRKKGESVVVNGNITIVVVDVRGDKARIGIEAPADVAVYRSEVLTKSAAAKDGESDASPTSRKAKNGGETQRRGKSGDGRGARKKTVATPVEKRDVAVETLYLSSESEAYRRCDAAEEASAANERDAANVVFEAVEAKNNVK